MTYTLVLLVAFRGGLQVEQIPMTSQERCGEALQIVMSLRGPAEPPAADDLFGQALDMTTQDLGGKYWPGYIAARCIEN